MTDVKIEALAKFLNADISEFKKMYPADEIYSYKNEEYMIYTVRERYSAMVTEIENILESDGWIFNLDLKKYIVEDNKYAIKIYNIIDDPYYFTKTEQNKIFLTAAKNGALDIDKLITVFKRNKETGLLLNSYDGKEYEFTYKTVKYYIYRIN